MLTTIDKIVKELGYRPALLQQFLFLLTSCLLLSKARSCKCFSWRPYLGEIYLKFNSSHEVEMLKRDFGMFGKL